MDKYDDAPPPAEEFAKVLIEDIGSIARQFQKKENCNAAPAFLQFLEAAKIYKVDEETEVNWEELLTNLILSKYFSSVYQQALRYTVY